MSHPAIAYMSHHQYEEGAMFCELAIAEMPDEPSNYWYLGLIRLLQGNEAEAQAVWFSALTTLEPGVLETEIQVLIQLLKTEANRQFELGLAPFVECIDRHILELDANQPEIYLQLGQAISLQGRLDEALNYWQIASQLQPNLVESYLYQAEVWQKLEQWEPAIALYQQVLAHQSTATLHYQLGVCLGEQRHWSDALGHLTHAIALQPDFGPAYGDSGWAHLQLGDWDAATQDFHIALQKSAPLAQTYHNWMHHLRQAQAPCPANLEHNVTLVKNLGTDAQTAWHHWQQSRFTAPPHSTAAPIATESPSAPPAGYILDTQAWAASQANVTYRPVDSASVIRLRPPKTCDRAIHFSFRLEHEIPLPPTFVLTLPQGRYWLNANQSSSAVLTQTHQLIGDLSPEFPLLTPGHPDKHPANHSLFQQPSLPPVQAISGTVAVLAGLTNDMYFHWLFDVLPRFDILQRSGVDTHAVDYFLISAELPFQQETLDLLNIPKEKILDPTPGCHIQADQLIVPSYPGSPAWMTKRVCKWLQKLILTSHATSQNDSDRLYITRQQTSNRRIINESELIDWLRPLGFQTVALETLSVQEQATLLAQAKVVISAHGGGLTNLAFCRPGTTVIELFSSHFVYPCYWVLSNLLHLDYYYLTGTLPTGHFLHQALYPNPRLADIWVDLRELKQLLQHAHIA